MSVPSTCYVCGGSTDIRKGYGYNAFMTRAYCHRWWCKLLRKLGYRYGKGS